MATGCTVQWIFLTTLAAAVVPVTCQAGHDGKRALIVIDMSIEQWAGIPKEVLVPSKTLQF
jgi:hypothetical protein